MESWVGDKSAAGEVVCNLSWDGIEMDSYQGAFAHLRSDNKVIKRAMGE